MKRSYYFILITVLSITSVLAMKFADARNEYPDKHLEVVFRSIGHQLLLHAKDSTSRVLPVTKINEHIYQISFEKSFGFTPDTLMNLVNQQLTKAHIPGDYIVSVNECNTNKTVFAYEINTIRGDLKPCGEREQEMGCYLIQIDFSIEKPFNYAWLLTAFVPIFSLGFFLKRRYSQKEDSQRIKENGIEKTASSDDKIVAVAPEFKQLGKFRFFDVKGILSINDDTIELSEKEIKALKIFTSNQNLVVERDRLKKEIWEDEGVLVIDRNVDVLVSKLRKKLSSNPSVKIVNVHGRGYKFITE